MGKRATGGVFGEIDAMLARFERDKEWFRAAVKDRCGSPRSLRVRNGLYAVRWNHEWHHAPTVDGLLLKLVGVAKKPSVRIAASPILLPEPRPASE